MKEKNEGSVEELISQLQQFDNPKGYRLEYETVKEKLEQIESDDLQEGHILHRILENAN